MVEVNKNIIIGIVALVVILLLWGIIGGVVSSDAGISCTFGNDGSICWVWEKNLIGSVGDTIKNVFG